MAAKKPHPLMQNRAEDLSPEAARLLEKAGKAISRNELDAAEVALIGVLAMAPECVEAKRLLGIGQLMRGEYGEAAALLRELIEQKPDDALVHMNLGSALYAKGEVEDAMASLQKACDLAPDFASAWFNLGKVFRMQGRTAGAITALHRALDIDPDHASARIILAEAQLDLGMLGPAANSFREAVRRNPGQVDAWLGLYNLKTERFDKADVARLQKALHAPFAPVDARIALGFVLARALEDQGDYAGAFRTLRHANALKRDQVRWDSRAARQEVAAIQEAFRAPLAGAEDARLGEEVIFIVSLPRSGSTLTEQILASHPQVEGAGELVDLQQVIDEESARRKQAFPAWANAATPDDWSRLGRDYMARTRRWRERRPRFTDKNLLNWRLVGAAMAMLPGARVINSRRDPLENCLGCYRQLFPKGNHFTYELDDMASYWGDYDRLSRHWLRLFPQRFFEHEYEALLADPEAQVRRLLAFCDLEYDPACLQFHKTERVVHTASAGQVRQPLQKTAPRSAAYDVKLDRLRILLDQAARANR